MSIQIRYIDDEGEEHTSEHALDTTKIDLYFLSGKATKIDLDEIASCTGLEDLVTNNSNILICLL